MPIYHLTDIRRLRAGREVLRIDDLRVEPGSILGLVGHNGSGKSTLLRLLALVDLADAGCLRFKENIFGRNAGAEAVAESGLWKFRRDVTMLGQESYLLKRSVGANLSYGLQLRGVELSSAALFEKQSAALHSVGLDPERYLRRSWRELSGGEAQRVALAARLILKPEVLLLDEPTASLDEDSVDLIRKAALEARERDGTTLVVVSHDWLWLQSISDNILRLKQGRVVSEVSPECSQQAL